MLTQLAAVSKANKNIIGIGYTHMLQRKQEAGGKGKKDEKDKGWDGGGKDGKDKTDSNGREGQRSTTKYPSNDGNHAELRNGEAGKIKDERKNDDENRPHGGSDGPHSVRSDSDESWWWWPWGRENHLQEPATIDPRINMFALIVDGQVVLDYQQVHVIYDSSVMASGTDSPPPVFRTKFGTIGAALGVDYGFPSFLRRASNGADIMLQSGKDRGASSLQSQMAQFRAVENGFTLIRCATGGHALQPSRLCAHIAPSFVPHILFPSTSVLFFRFPLFPLRHDSPVS
jgi:hypothetical protein